MNQRRFREHLASCYLKNKLTSFPKKYTYVYHGLNYTSKILTSMVFNVICNCKLPRHYAEIWICPKCLNQYHMQCVDGQCPNCS